MQAEKVFEIHTTPAGIGWSGALLYYSGCIVCEYVFCGLPSAAPERLPLADVALVTLKRRCPMNATQLKGKWEQFTGDAKRQWGKLTDDDMSVVEGDADALAGKIRERYGKDKEEAEREVKDWIDSL